MKITLHKQKRHKGFSAVEVMTAIVIIGIIVAIGVANYLKSSRDRAFEASLMSNMRTLQIMLETYKVDYQVYPENLYELGSDASNKKYNKSATNPYTKQSGLVGSTNAWCIDFKNPVDSDFFSMKDLYIGKVGYFYSTSDKKYTLFGYNGDGQLLERKGGPYTVTSGG